jgi:uncharacterized protein YidB (DUF937 family)
MGSFDGVLGGIVGTELTTVVHGLIEKHSDVRGVVAQLEQQGLGATVQSWIGPGANQPISPQQLDQAFGCETIEQFGRNGRPGPSGLLQKLPQAWLQAVGQLSPAGRVTAH